MLHKKIYKPIDDKLDEYSALADWCNQHNAMIVDQGDYYEAVPVPEPTTDELAKQVRATRDALLAETDYLVMPDYPISADELDAVKTYRQALRDVPMQDGFPESPKWPEVPKIARV